MDYKDYYKILGISKSANEKDIRSAYRRLAKQFHPDRNPGDKEAERKFKEINEAHDVLSDPAKRRKYDQLGANWKQYEQWQRASGGAGGRVDVGDLFRGARSRAGGGSATAGNPTVSQEELEEIFSTIGERTGGGGFSDFFQTFFGGGSRTGAGRSRPTTTTGSTGSTARRGHDIDQPVDISLEEAFNGTTRVVQLTDEGSGKTRRLEVKIPPGVSDGARVRIAGQGGPGALGGSSGDLYMVVHVTPSPLFAREGDDLRVKVPVRLTTAVLGGEIDVPTPKGTKLALKVPPNTQDGRVFRLRGQGMPRLNSTERGDLFAEVHVQVPEQLTPRQRQLFEELASLELATA